MQLKWTDLAVADLDKIAKENSPSVAIDVVIKILDTTHLILPEHPSAAGMADGKGQES